MLLSQLRLATASRDVDDEFVTRPGDFEYPGFEA
jgi:hypothetical protein